MFLSEDQHVIIGIESQSINLTLSPRPSWHSGRYPQAAEPVLRVMLEESTRKIAGHRGELAAIVQYVYSLAASRLQPFLRGALARCRLPDVHWEMFSYVRILDVLPSYGSDVDPYGPDRQLL